MNMSIKTHLPSTPCPATSDRPNLRALAIILLLLVTGCATASFNPASSETWLSDGNLALLRPVPKQNHYSEKTSSEPMARMRPPEPEQSNIPPHLIVHGASHSLTLSLPGSAPITIKAQGTYAMKPGSYAVALKQNDPLWYAPPTYFLRFMRGALGNKAIFLDREIPIHSGPMWTEEIGGLRVSADDMARIFDAVTVGGQVEVQ